MSEQSIVTILVSLISGSCTIFAALIVARNKQTHYTPISDRRYLANRSKEVIVLIFLGAALFVGGLALTYFNGWQRLDWLFITIIAALLIFALAYYVFRNSGDLRIDDHLAKAEDSRDIP